MLHPCGIGLCGVLGYPDQALQKSHEVLTLAQELAHPFSMALALVVAAWFHQYCREEQVVQEQAEAVIALSTEQGFPFWSVWATILRGWALAECRDGGKKDCADTSGPRCHAGYGGRAYRSHFLALLAEAYGKVRAGRRRAERVAEALVVVDKTGERFYEAELYRLKGRADTAEVSGFKSPAPTFNLQSPCRGGSRSVLPESHRDCPSTEGEVVGATGSDEPQPPMATTRQASRSSPDVIRDL